MDWHKGTRTVVIAIVTGLIVHIFTKMAVKQPIPFQSPQSIDHESSDRSQNVAINPAVAQEDSEPIYESIGLSATTTGASVQMQSNPAYQETPDYLQ